MRPQQRPMLEGYASPSGETDCTRSDRCGAGIVPGGSIVFAQSDAAID